jgi:hypothetical protein
MKKKLASDKTNIVGLDPQETKFARELYDKRTNFVVQQFNNDYFLTDTEITVHLQSILEKIYRSNPTLKNETQVYAFRNEAVNAMSFGEGTIAFTLGLLSRMENDDQIAFVLCHELAHYHSRHSDLKTIELAKLNYDKDLQKKVKSISKSEYGKYTKYSQLIKSLDLSITTHSREKEFEADSTALLLFLNTTYNRDAPVRTLQILDHADESIYPANIDFKKYFNFQEYPFKESWNAYTRSNTWYASNDTDNDSTHTHPSCARRIIALERQLKGHDTSKNFVTSQVASQFSSVKVSSDFEIIASQYHFKQFGKALFNALVLQERYPENAYLHSIISQCLYQLYVNQKDHTLGKVLTQPDPRFDENYDRFLTFIHRLRLMELASISYHYTMSKKSSYENNEDFLYACWLNSHSEVSHTDPSALKAEYISKFPSGKYLSAIK